MSCVDCLHARSTDGRWNRFDSRKCVYCAARLLQAIGRRQVSREVISRRRTECLQESVAAGLDEARIRAMVKGPLAIEPVDRKGKGAAK